MLLAGSPPFFDASEPRLLRSIMHAKYDFDTEAWEPVRHQQGSDLHRRAFACDCAVEYCIAHVESRFVCFYSQAPVCA